MTALVCSMIDALLILLEVLGFGQLISAYPLSIQISKYFAIIFLFFYGVISLKSSLKSKSLEIGNEQIYFTLGAISASFLWFFAITYGSYLLAPLLSKPTAWRIIDGLIALTMWGIAATLIIVDGPSPGKTTVSGVLQF